jgi:hypothetical protein
MPLTVLAYILAAFAVSVLLARWARWLDRPRHKEAAAPKDGADAREAERRER